MMRNTYVAKKETIQRDWLVIDATNKTVGRLSTEVATLLRGKHKPIYTPNVDCGDYVIIINAEKVKFTGKKLEDKYYYRHSNHPGGLKSESAGKLLARKPERILEHSVRGMLPKTKLGRQMFKKMYIYTGNEHPHGAQQPVEYELKG